MTGVFLCSPTNSTMFTTCCEVAICDYQQKCPCCNKYVYPFNEYMTDKEREDLAGGYYNSKTRELRWQHAYRH
jgi:hypothetical protein